MVVIFSKETNFTKGALRMGPCCMTSWQFCLSFFVLFWQTMGSVNAQMNPAQLQNTLKNFEMESTKMDMKEEMSELKQ